MGQMLKTVHKILKICRAIFCNILNKSQWLDTSIARERVSKVVSADCKIVSAQFLQLETGVCSDEPFLTLPHPGPTPPDSLGFAGSCLGLQGFTGICSDLLGHFYWAF